MDIVTMIAILVLAAFVGFEVISKVPNTLHTPLMSGTNAIHGIVVLASANVVGGFVVTDRMLEMFKKRDKPEASSAPQSAAGKGGE